MILLHIMQRHAVVVWGKAKKHKLEVQRTHSCAIPEGLLINGFIQDEEAFAQWAKTMVSELGLKGKSVTVIADSTAVIYRQIETPKLKAKALEEAKRRAAARMEQAKADGEKLLAEEEEKAVREAAALKSLAARSEEKAVEAVLAALV